MCKLIFNSTLIDLVIYPAIIGDVQSRVARQKVKIPSSGRAESALLNLSVGHRVQFCLVDYLGKM